MNEEVGFGFSDASPDSRSLFAAEAAFAVPNENPGFGFPAASSVPA
jgi:hypothetical protein